MNQHQPKNTPAPSDQQDLVSVLIPAYNHGKYVQSTIQSILDQTYAHIELIIVNDGSTDNTHEQIEALLPRCKERFVRTDYLQKENEGIIKTFNQGLKMAQGQYVYIIASDDMAEPTAIEILHTFLAGHDDFGLAVGDNLFMDEKGKPCYWDNKQATVYDAAQAFALTHAEYLQKARKDIDFSGPSFGSYKALLGGNHIPNGYLIRNQLIKLVGGYSEQAKLEDLNLMLQLAKYTKFKFIDQPLFYYRWHDANTSKQRNAMEQYTRETLQLEDAYIKSHGMKRYVPLNRSWHIRRVKIMDYLRTGSRTHFRLFNTTCFCSKIKNNQRSGYLMGIRIYRKPLHPGKEV
jgi:alpha-1,3-rhamnosyltransferase